jgi:hypothetical protein
MKRIQAVRSGLVRRGAGVIIAVTLAALVGGCVIYPAGPGYYGGGHGYYGRGWR